MKTKALLALISAVCVLSACTALAVPAQEWKEAWTFTYNIPKMTKPPVIDGKIGDDEWTESVQFARVASVITYDYYVRPVSYRISWDDEHLYIAARSWINPGEKFLKNQREKYTTQTVFDDSYEFGLGMEDRNRLAGESHSFFKFILNSLGAGEYLKMYPSIGQYLYNWAPDMKIGNGISPDGRWWDMEISADLKDLQTPTNNKPGDVVRLLLARDFHNPDWMQTQVPVSKGFMDDTGYTKGTFTADQPYVRVGQLDGLADEKVSLRSVLYNPGSKPVKLRVKLGVTQETQKNWTEAPVTDNTVFTDDKIIEVPAGGSVNYDLDRELPGIEYRPPWPYTYGVFDFKVTLAENESAVVYTSHYQFSKDAEKKILVANPSPPFNFVATYNPVRNNLWIDADTLDADIPAGSKVAGFVYEVKQGMNTVSKGRVTRLVRDKFNDLVQLPELEPGKYTVTGSLVDGSGKALISRDIEIVKKDEAKEFSAWWGNNIGDCEKVLRPFTPLKVKGSDVSCVLRTYSIDSLGLPRQIIARDGKVLSSPARIVVTVAGKDYVVPVTSPRITDRKDWRVSFAGNSSIAGIKFAVKGTVEQDGLVELFLTYAPEAKPVEIESLRIEWPVDDSLQARMACNGLGANYSCRKFGDIPAGKGVVWDTLKDMGKVGSGMLLGNFYSYVWIGTEKRGLLWSADSDEGWVPRDDTAAHEIVRDGKSVILRNNLTKTPKGEKPFTLDKARTVHFSYNASPFKPLEPGWRMMMRSACNGFSGPGYKVSRDGNLDGWNKLCPPTTNVSEWPGYYAEYKAKAEKASLMGLYDVQPRLHAFLCNQLPLRNYGSKTLEPGVDDYFSAEWYRVGQGSEETLTKNYGDYFVYLQDRWAKEGGLRSVYYDISMITSIAAPWNGHGYFLPDGRIQPSGDCFNQRRYVMRVNAMFQERGYYPGGVSGHCTNSFPMIAMPWYDSLIDSEFYFTDGIDNYPSDRMIAISCPDSFGTQIDHLGYLNDNWAMIHDASYKLMDPEFRNFGTGQADAQFIPYWRNENYVKGIGKGLIASMWKRPNAVMIEVMNHGPDPDKAQKARKMDLTLNLKALGIPAGIKPEQIRVREIERSRIIPSRYMAQLDWVKALPKANPDARPLDQYSMRPDINPTINAATGKIGGFDIGYHDQRYLVVSWDETPIKPGVASDFDKKMLPLALEWGVNRAKQLTSSEVAQQIRPDNKSFAIKAWKKPGSVLLRLENTSDKTESAIIDLDLQKLGVKVKPEKLWQEFTQLYDMEDRRVKPWNNAMVSNVVWDSKTEPTPLNYPSAGAASFDGWANKLLVTLVPGDVRYLCIDKD